MQKELSIQDLENIDFNQFKENPSELIQIGKKLMSFNRNDKAIEAFEFGLKTIIAQNNNNEFHIDCAKFNYYYADVLIAKLYESNEIFNNKNLPEEEKKETKENSDTIEEDAINNINCPAKDIKIKSNKMIEDDKEDEEVEDDSEEVEEE